MLKKTRMCEFVCNFLSKTTKYAVYVVYKNNNNEKAIVSIIVAFHLAFFAAMNELDSFAFQTKMLKAFAREYGKYVTNKRAPLDRI